jgi:hypothetical protein
LVVWIVISNSHIQVSKDNPYLVIDNFQKKTQYPHLQIRLPFDTQPTAFFHPKSHPLSEPGFVIQRKINITMAVYVPTPAPFPNTLKIVVRVLGAYRINIWAMKITQKHGRFEILSRPYHYAQSV